jgi:hypothetical protein
MKAMVHNSRALTQDLVAFILQTVTVHPRAFKVSPVKADGTVIIRFRGSPEESPNELTYRFIDQLSRRSICHVQTDDNKVRVMLSRSWSPDELIHNATPERSEV